MALERAEADVAVGQPGQHRRRGSGSARRCAPAPRRSRSGRSEREVGHAQRLQHGGGQHLAHAALQGQASVAAARPGRLPRALGAEVEQARPRRLRAAGRTGSRGRRRGPDCRCGTGGRGSAWPAAAAWLSGRGSKRAKCARHSSSFSVVQAHGRRRPLVAEAQDRLAGNGAGATASANSAPRGVTRRPRSGDRGGSRWRRACPPMPHGRGRGKRGALSASPPRPGRVSREAMARPSTLAFLKTESGAGAVLALAALAAVVMANSPSRRRATSPSSTRRWRSASAPSTRPGTSSAGPATG